MSSTKIINYKLDVDNYDSESTYYFIGDNFKKFPYQSVWESNLDESDKIEYYDTIYDALMAYKNNKILRDCDTLPYWKVYLVQANKSGSKLIYDPIWMLRKRNIL